MTTFVYEPNSFFSYSAQLDSFNWQADQKRPLSKDMVFRQRWPGSDVVKDISFNELMRRFKPSDEVLARERLRLSFPRIEMSCWKEEVA
jgi:hypothetical protein